MTGKYSSVVSKSDDGTIQITFTIPFEEIKKRKEAVVLEKAKNITVPGFRKGMAPLDKVAGQLPKEEIVQKTLSGILPEAIAEVVKKENLDFAIYPKFELVSADDDKPWQIRATSCDLPSLELGNYKKVVEEGLKNKKEAPQNEKEGIVLKQILAVSEARIPKLLIEEDVNQRLSNLLDRIERLGLNLESYLSSIGKTPETLREEYKKQSEESVTLEMALNKIADLEKIEVSEDQINEAIKASSTDPKLAEELQKPEKRKLLASILRRQETLKYLLKTL